LGFRPNWLCIIVIILLVNSSASIQRFPVSDVLGPGLEILAFELVDPELEIVVLEPEIATPRFEAVECCSYKDSDT
jgi:hypothetical protein